MGGYVGRILEVDLTTSKFSEKPLLEEYIDKFLGGAGICAKLAYDLIPKGTEPLDEKNHMIFGLGPFVGTFVPGAGKGNLTSKSMIPKLIGISGHGLFGMLKFSGYDHLIIRGKSSEPVYLLIDDKKFEIRDAKDLWGKDVFETTDILWKRHGSEYNVSCIGVAGENRVFDSSIITNKYATFARTGMGAVMGGKNLKAIVLFGKNKIKVKNREKFIEAVSDIYKDVTSHPNFLEWRRFGTLISLETFAKMGLYANKNFTSAICEELFEYFPLREGGFLEWVKEGDVSCLGCPVGCKHHIRIKKGPHKGTSLSISCVNSVFQSFGAFIDLKGWDEAIKCAETCARFGLDFMSVGNLLAMTAELFEKGIIDEKRTDGIRLSFGDGDAARKMIEKIAKREGFGDILADGIENAAERIGKDAKDYAISCKGLGLLYDPRVRLESTEIFSQFTNVRGYCSNVSIAMVKRTREQIERFLKRIGAPSDAIERVLDHPSGYNVARLTKWAEDVTTGMEILGLCQFPIYQRVNIEKYIKAYNYLTGRDITISDLYACSQRTWNIRKAFNVREGVGPEYDRLPKRFTKEEISIKGKLYKPIKEDEMKKLIEEYYDERGWDKKTGMPKDIE